MLGVALALALALNDAALVLLFAYIATWVNAVVFTIQVVGLVRVQIAVRRRRHINRYNTICEARALRASRKHSGNP